MVEIVLHDLSPEEFEELVVQMSIRILGTGTVRFSKGRDGGRDAIFSGVANRYPSARAPWTGQFVIQAKSTSNPIASCSDREFARVIRAEIPRIRALREQKRCDNYILFTNRKLSAAREAELTNQLRDETDVDNIALIGRETILSLLSTHPAVGGHGREARTVSAIAAAHQIRPAPADFAGRDTMLTEIQIAVREERARLIGLSGMGGAGKTALALKIAEVLEGSFSDAQISVDMLGFHPRPLGIREVAIKVIRGIEPNADLPDNEDELLGLYHSLLKGRRGVLLLDNAIGGEELTALVGHPEVLTVVTSRTAIHLPGLRSWTVDPLPLGEAAEFLRLLAPRISGPSSTRLAHICSGLPLALRLTGSALAERPDLSAERYADTLSSRSNRLALVEASVALSFDLLAESLKPKWAQLSVFNGTFRSDEAASIWGCEADEAESALAELVRVSLLTWSPAFQEYELHDLLRLFAQKVLSAEDREVAAVRHARYFSRLLGTAALLNRDVSKEAWHFGLANQILAQIHFNTRLSEFEAAFAYATSYLELQGELAIICADLAIAGVDLHRWQKNGTAEKLWLEAGLAAAGAAGDSTRQCIILLELALGAIAEKDFAAARSLASRLRRKNRPIVHAAIERDAIGILAACYEQEGRDHAVKVARELMLDWAYATGDWDLLYEDPVKSKVPTKRARLYLDALIAEPRPNDRLLAGRKSPPLGFIAVTYAGMGNIKKSKECCDTGLRLANLRGDRRAKSSFKLLKQRLMALT